MASRTIRSRSVGEGRRDSKELVLRRLGTFLENLVIYGFLSLIALTVLYPIVWMVSTSLKSDKILFKTLTQLIPSEPFLGNYKAVFEQADFLRYYLNSILITTCSVGGLLLITSMAAYSFGRTKWRGKELVFGLIVAGQLVAPVAIIMPVFIVINSLRLTSTYQGLIFLYLSRVPFGTFVLRAFFEAVPRGIEEVALIDGCSRYGVFWRIMLPLAKPAIASVGVFYFFFVWNDFLFPFVVLQKQQLMTIPVAVFNLRGTYQIAWGIQTAALTMAVIPAILASLFFQKQIVGGLTAGALKGGQD